MCSWIIVMIFLAFSLCGFPWPADGQQVSVYSNMPYMYQPTMAPSAAKSDYQSYLDSYIKQLQMLRDTGIQVFSFQMPSSQSSVAISGYQQPMFYQQPATYQSQTSFYGNPQQQQQQQQSAISYPQHAEPIVLPPYIAPPPIPQVISQPVPHQPAPKPVTYHPPPQKPPPQRPVTYSPPSPPKPMTYAPQKQQRMTYPPPKAPERPKYSYKSRMKKKRYEDDHDYHRDEQKQSSRKYQPKKHRGYDDHAKDYDYDPHDYHDDRGYDDYDNHDVGYGSHKKKSPKKEIEKVYVPVRVRRKKKKMKIVSIMPGFYVAGGTQIFGKFKTLKKCQMACAATPSCFAGDYNPWLYKCYLHTNFTACSAIRGHKKLIHFKKVTCEVPEAPEGLVTLGAQLFRGIEQKGIKSLSDCLKKCATAGTGIPASVVNIGDQLCFGIDYDFGSHTCYFHVDNTNFRICPDDGTTPLTPRDLVANPAVINIILCPGP